MADHNHISQWHRVTQSCLSTDSDASWFCIRDIEGQLLESRRHQAELLVERNDARGQTEYLKRKLHASSKQLDGVDAEVRALRGRLQYAEDNGNRTAAALVLAQGSLDKAVVRSTPIWLSAVCPCLSCTPSLNGKLQIIRSCPCSITRQAYKLLQSADGPHACFLPFECTIEF